MTSLASATVTLLAVCFSHASAQKDEKALTFDVVSIKPSTLSGGGGRNGGDGGNPPAVRNGGPGLRFAPGRVSSGPAGVTAWKIILEAYRLTPYQLSGGAGWVDSDRFDLEGRAEAATESQLRQMLRTLLAERFQLTLHREMKETAVYALTIGKNGAKLHEWKPGDRLPEFNAAGHVNNFRDTGTMQRLIDTLSAAAGRPVLDRTGLKGTYVFYAGWDEGGDLLSAVQDQLGLRLESQKAPMEVFTIDRIEKPGANEP